MFRIKGTSTLLILFFSTLLHSQNYVSDTSLINTYDIFSQLNDETHGGDIDFYQNASLHVLVDRCANLNVKNGIDGYRIQIYSGSGGSAREKANDVKSQFYDAYPEITNCPVYIDYRAPYFRVKIGDFRNKNEAYFIYQKIKEDFPTSYIVKSKINFPELDLSKEE